MKESRVWVSRSSRAWEIFRAWAQAETAIMLLRFLFPDINLACVLRRIVFDG